MNRVVAITFFLAALQVMAMVARLMRKQRQSSLLLAIAAVIPFAFLVVWSVRDRSMNWGVVKLMLPPAAALALGVASFWHRQRAIFWLGWLLNLPLLVMLIYFEFFWRIRGGF